MLLSFLLLLFPSAVFASTETVIQDGVYIMGIDMSGKTKTEAMLAIDSYFQEIQDQSFTLTCVDGSVESLSLTDLGFEWNAAKTVTQAARIGNSGSLIQRYKDRMNLEYGNIYLEVPFYLSEALVTNRLNELSSLHDNPAQNAQMSHVDGAFVISEEAANGTVTDTDATIKQINHGLADYIESGSIQSLTATVVTKTDYPTITSADLKDIKDNLGTFTTDYSDSSSNRKINVQTATNYLNGTILQPGESLSTSTAIMPREEEYGYKMAAQYSNGESEQDIGGGVCQVSTTLYNAVLRAELQVDTRYNHSMVVHYVEYGDDAAIATGTKDLVFTNTYDTPVYIEGIADGDTLTFTIYGKETRPANRTIAFISETLSEEWPASDDYNEKYSSDYPTGETHITGTRRPAVTATLTKVVYIDNVETERELLHTDYYSGSKLNKVHGTG